MKQEELKIYYDIYTDCWKLFKKYAYEEDKSNHDFWQNFAKESRNLRIKYKENKLACDIILGTYREIERLENKNDSLFTK